MNLGVVEQQSEVSRAVGEGRLGQQVDEEAAELLPRLLLLAALALADDLSVGLSDFDLIVNKAVSG
jgi:hypothetical protein